ncbi:prolyl oligopeptidase family serine peptidase [Phenylobacterium sp. LjRoot219]|uniref:alpha/beta hydrolase family protein n=1 Tax=Phenylobacterium sp. LjRoot219 TaxID=3342283 RepID=UPI003ECC6C49
MLHRTPLLALAALLLSATLARAGVSFQRLTVPDPQGAPIEVGIWSPQADPAAPPPRTRRPLVVISHGTGGGLENHADTAKALAEAGFVAAALTHPGDNWRDLSRQGRIWERPGQFLSVVDYLLTAWPGRATLDPDRVGAFGFSAGGFTVLAAAGGAPDLALTRPHCQTHPDYFDCRLITRTGAAAPAGVTWPHDRRIKALVVAAPALGFTFRDGGLAAVRQPVQLWRAGNDQILPAPDYAEAVRQALPQAPDFHTVPDAGHFDFLAPCSAALAQRAPEICASAPGFDRAAFHADFNHEVVDFFQRTLGQPR